MGLVFPWRAGHVDEALVAVVRNNGPPRRSALPSKQRCTPFAPDPMSR
jgi:hypothetical protein